MQITFPHMGTFSIPLKSLFENLGHTVIVPPAVTDKTIKLGSRHSPEFACFPLKVNMGNYIESLEMGADTIIMAGGVGPCRFGYYAQIQKAILTDLGYSFNMIVLEPPQSGIQELTNKLSSLSNGKSLNEIRKALKIFWNKAKALDRLHKLTLEKRPFEISKGSIRKIYNDTIEAIDKAQTKRQVWASFFDGKSKILLSCKNKLSPEKELIKIVLVGEIYMLLEPYANMDIEETLGNMGVQVERTIYISEWIKEHIFLNSLKINTHKKYKKAAAPYLNHFIGGHGWESIGDTVLASQRGIEGVIHILPFTCTPEIVAQSILPTVSRENAIPVMSFSLDEHSARAGFRTRLEAFVDLLRHNKKVLTKGKSFKVATF